MSNATLLRSLLAALSLTTASLMVTACGKTSASITAENIQEQPTITEQHEAGSVVWSVDPEGHVAALVRGPDGKPIEKDVTGTVTVKGPGADDVPIAVALVPDPDKKVLVSVIPMLQEDLTEMKYEVKAGDKPMKGTLHLPPGGTVALVESSKVAAEVKIPEGKKGPNGGTIQVVGDTIVEVVADKSSGQVRAYVLDADLKPTKIGTKKITIGFVTEKGPDTIVLVPDPGGLYFVGKTKVVVNPVKITVAVTDGDYTDVVLCGWYPGKVVVVGAGAPTIVVFAPVKWDVVVVNPTPVIVVDDHHHHWHGKGKGKGKWHYKGKKGGIHINIH